MSSYTPIPLPYDYLIEGYGLHGPVVDGLLIALEIARVRDAQSACVDTGCIVSDIVKAIEKAKLAHTLHHGR